MAASFNESQKIDYLWKKVGYGVTKTAEPESKQAFNETIPSPLLYRGDLVWTNSGDIPSTPPASTTAIVEVYKDGVGSFEPTVQCTEDLTAPDNQTWKTNLANWIPTQFGDNYLVQVYAAAPGITNAQTTGTKLFGAGSGSDDTWFFDYQSGVLNFNGATIPTPIGTGTGNTIYVVGYRYVGTFGVGGAAVLGNLTISNTTISTGLANATITIQPTGTGLVSIDTTTGLILPVGNTAQRPSPGTTGTVRFNTTTSRVEVYDGTEWDTIVGGVTNQTLNGDGSTVTFSLDRSTTTAAALVILNGITQVPTQAYAMSPSPSANLVFTEAPSTGDVIDIRFL
jgi:hypothetical protein